MANEKRLLKVCDATAVYNGIALYMAENAYLNDTALDVLKMVAKWLDDAPNVEAVEVVHGRWIEDYETFVQDNGYESEPIHTGFVCSVCGRHSFAIEPYCHCGAKMDGGNEDG